MGVDARYQRLPERVIHCDWSVAPQKRWSASAERRGGRWQAGAPELAEVGALRDALGARRALVGFDFPIGVPAPYAARCQLASFVELLDALPAHGEPAGSGTRWAELAEVASSAQEISLRRPFYPARPGGTRRAHLVTGLGLATSDDLYRRCEVATGRRACPIFWTLGGNQVGRAALSGWREVLVPARRRGEVAIWPFDGDLGALLEGDRSVVVETYPADACGYTGIDHFPVVDGRRGKRVAGSRAACAPRVEAWMHTTRIDATPALRRALRAGFGDDREGEDRFDAVLGLLGMLAVLDGHRAAGAPTEPAVQRIEGWILGRRALAETDARKAPRRAQPPRTGEAGSIRPSARPR
jgi:hypothetical protein